MSTADDDYHKQRAEAEGCTVEEAKERTLRDLEQEARHWWVKVDENYACPYWMWRLPGERSAHEFAKWLSFETEAQVLFGIETKAVYRDGVEPEDWLAFKNWR